MWPLEQVTLSRESEANEWSRSLVGQRETVAFWCAERSQSGFGTYELRAWSDTARSRLLGHGMLVASNARALIAKS